MVRAGNGEISRQAHDPLKIAAAYIRVSTDDQIEYSPDSQKKAIVDYAQKHGYIVPETFIYMDEGISGRNTKRPEFQRMIGAAKQKPRLFEAILVWKFSRFARNREDSIVYKSMLRKQCGIDVISISEQLGEDKTSILIEALLEAMDEYYSINLAEEVVRGMSEKARRGGVLGSAAFGYHIENGVLAPDPDEAPIVKKIFEDCAAGKSTRKIAMQLNEFGIRTRYGNRWDNRNVEYLLRNRTYTGKMHWTPGGTKRQAHADKITENTIISANSHAPIIPEQLFRIVQERMSQNKRKYAGNAHQEHGMMYMLKGLVKCSACGYTLTMSRRNDGVQCHQYARGKCTESHFIRITKLNRLVLDQIREDMGTGNFITALDGASEISEDRYGFLKKQLGRVKQKLDRVKASYQAGIDTLEEYRENKIRVQSEMGMLLEQIRDCTPKVQEQAKEPHKVIKSNLAILEAEGIPEALKNDVLCTFVKKIEFDRKKTQVTICYKI